MALITGGCSTELDHLTCNTKIEGSNPATVTERGKIANNHISWLGPGGTVVNC